MKKIAIICALGLFCGLTVKGFVAAPSEFPHSFVSAIQQNIETITKVAQGCDDTTRVVGPISLMSEMASCRQIKKLHAQLEQLTMSEAMSPRIDAIRLSCLYKLAVPLVVEMNRQLLLTLAQLDEQLTFWKGAEEWYVSFHLHKKSPQKIVHRLEIMQEELYELLGNIAVHVSMVPCDKDAQTQYEWLRILCNHFNACIPRQKTIVAKPVFEAVSALFAQAINSVEKFPESCERRLQCYAQPSWVRQYCFGLVGGIGALFAGGSSAAQYKTQIVTGAQTVQRNAKTYANATADALWGNDQQWEHDLGEKESAIRASYMRTLMHLLPYFTEDNCKREQIIEKVVRQKLGSENFEQKFEQAELRDKQLGLIMGEVREKKTFKVDELVRVDGLGDLNRSQVLKKVYCPLFGTTDLPHLKKCVPALSKDFLNKFNEHEIETAAGNLDLHYFGEVVTLVSDALSKEGVELGYVARDIRQIIEDTDLGTGNNIRQALHDAWPSLFRQRGSEFEHKGYDAALKAIAQRLNGESQIVDTTTMAPNLALLGGRITAVKGERKCLEIWRKSKLLVMIAIGYFVFRVGKDVVGPPLSYIIKRSWPKDSSYDGLFETLRELKKLFLVNGDKQQSEMDPYDVGLTHYLVYKLEREAVPKKYQKKFLQDVRLLQASNFTANQKYNIVKDVLQDGYPFLRLLAQAA